MTRLRIVDAFSDRAFAGNPAAVIRLDDRDPSRLPDETWYQRMAAEINTPATGFVLPADGADADFRLRWFTASVELELCGHATLASSRCLFDDGIAGPIRFATRSGVHTVRQDPSGAVVLDFPAQPAKQIEPPDDLVDALGGAEPIWVGEGGGDYLVELADAAVVRQLQPNLELIARYPVRGVIVTASSDVPDADFVSRFFPPSVGIAEDPVTGSAHTVLAPFWAERLGTNRLTGLQVSRRTGRVGIRLAGDRAELSGTAVVVLDGQLMVEIPRRVSTGGPLAGVLVLDLSRALAGPHAAMMLGDQGARVIKVEAPGTGDDTRGWGPPFLYPEHGERESSYFMSCNRNKESIALDLKSEDGRQLLTRLIRQADVLVENFRTGVLDRLGFPMRQLHELNPRLVILSITGFGHDGPEGGRAGYDQIAQGEGGLMSLTGNRPDEPTKVGAPVADLLAGMYGAFGAVAALHERNRTGRGSVVRTSLLAGVVGVHAFQGTRYTVAGEVPGTAGAHHPSICPYGLFHAADGMVQIAVGSDRLWSAFAAAFGIDRPQWQRNADRVSDRDAVVAAVDAAFGGYQRDELMRRLAELGIPAGQVRSLDEVYAWEQTRSQGLLVSVEHPTLGTLQLPGPPVRYDEGGRTEHLAPPTLDQHGADIRRWLDEVEPGAAR